MGLRLRLWSLSQDRRPAIDSPQAVWEFRPTRLRIGQAGDAVAESNFPSVKILHRAG